MAAIASPARTSLVLFTPIYRQRDSLLAHPAAAVSRPSGALPSIRSRDTGEPVPRAVARRLHREKYGLVHPVCEQRFLMPERVMLKGTWRFGSYGGTLAFTGGPRDDYLELRADEQY